MKNVTLGADDDLIERACDRYKMSWYDALIVAGALEGQCSVLYSADLHDGLRIGELRIANPFRGL